jgi:hypothetical protein
VQIKPENFSNSYLFLMKFGDNPVLKQDQKSYDFINLFCPNGMMTFVKFYKILILFYFIIYLDTITDSNDTFYLFYTSMASINGYKGYIGFSITELNDTELGIFDCNNKSSINDINNQNKLIDTRINNNYANQTGFSQNFYFRIYASGCYYLDPITNIWMSDGVDILPDSNLTHSHCISNHLTSFAGGFIVLPNQIDFKQVWANASFLQNPIIYSTVIAIFCLYLLLAII